METAVQLLVNVLIPGSIFGLIIAGFNLIYRVTRLMHVAHGAVAIFAGYVFYAALVWRHLPAGAAFVIAVAAAAGLGWALNTLVYERLRERRGMAAAGALVATLSLLFIIQNAILMAFGSAAKSFPALTGSSNEFGPVLLTTHEIRLLIVGPLILALAALFLKRTRTGKAIRAVADNEAVAEVVGISAKRVRAIVMTTASAVAGVAGVLFAIEYGLEPVMATGVSVRMFYHAIVGGLGGIGAAAVGTLFMQTVYALTGWYLNIGWADAAEFGVMLAVLLVRPQGLLGARRRRV